MPAKMHEALKKEAAKRGMTGKQADQYIYGTLNKYEQKKKAKKRGKSR